MPRVTPPGAIHGKSLKVTALYNKEARKDGEKWSEALEVSYMAWGYWLGKPESAEACTPGDHPFLRNPYPFEDWEDFVECTKEDRDQCIRRWIHRSGNVG